MSTRKSLLLIVMVPILSCVACTIERPSLALDLVTIGIASDESCSKSIFPLLQSRGIDVEFDPGAVMMSGVQVKRAQEKLAKELILEDARVKGYHFIEIEAHRQRLVDDWLAQDAYRHGMEGLLSPQSSYSLDWAIAYFDGAIRLRPDNPTTFGARAYAKAKRCDEKGALQDLEKAELLLRQGNTGYVLHIEELNRMRESSKPR